MKTSDFDLAVEVLRSGDRARLAELRQLLDGFPEGVDSFVGRRWILNAIDFGSRTSVEWIVDRHVDLSFRDEEGYTPLLTLIDSKRSDRYELLEALLRAGAPVNRKGINEWTPAHLAAARDDVDALRILVAHGADLSIRTDIDDFATPLEEARTLGSSRAVAFLESVATAEEAPTLARELFAVIDASDLVRTAALLDDSFQLHYQGVPDPISKGSLLEMLRSYLDSFPDMRHELLEVLPSGSFVTVRLVVYATHRGTYEGIAATGRQVVVAAIHILRVANGRVVEWWAAEDDLGLLRQLGAVSGSPA